MDLSGAYHKEGMGDFGWLLCLRKLVSLTLHNVQGRSLYEREYVKYAIFNTVISDVEDSLQTLCKLVDLQHLDISQCNESRGQFKSPVLFMERLVVSLSCLRSLDISGTNLAGAGGDRGTKEERLLCDIAGMETRWAGGGTAGGWGTHPPILAECRGRWTSSACTRLTTMPAADFTFQQAVYLVSVSVTRDTSNVTRDHTSHAGDTNEAQILVAGQRYLDRPTVLESILNDLFHVFRWRRTWIIQDFK